MWQNLSWLSQEARNIHGILSGLFYALVTVFLLLGVLVEYFKLPFGNAPAFGSLIGRALIAAILLAAYPQIANTVSTVSEEIAVKVGNVNNFDLIRAKMADKFHILSLSWVSIKENIVILLSYCGFVLLHFSIYVCNAFLIFTWILLYMFAPILIALYVLPQTVAATGMLFRSLIEVSTWKIVWSVLATLFWSTAVSDINKTDISFLSILCLNLMFAIALLITPAVVHALAGAGVSTLHKALGGLTMASAVLPAARLLRSAGTISKTSFNAAHTASAFATRKHFPRTHKAIQSIPRFHMPEKPPIFERPNPDKKKQKGKGR